ncbi:MAG: hemolysin family protein [Clostridiales Family XIII bacterium]|jgi:putative hemolysin|nr:hemolysin family protein [Clostridiales Family XIII bacterium]
MSDPDPDGSYLLQIIFLLILILINAFFAMAEMATVSVNRNSIRNLAEEGNKRARVLLELLEHPNRFLSTIQVWITLAGFLQSASAATAMAGDISRWLDGFGIAYSLQIAVVAITLILAFFNLVLGELTPKRIALQYSEKIALFTARPVWLVSKLAAPFVWLLSKTVSLVLRLFGIRKDSIEEKYSEEEIRSLLEVGQETGLIDEAGKEMITSVFEFDDKLAYEIMTPRTDVYMVNINDTLSDYADDLLKSRFSRIPYYDKDNDDIIGVLYMKDFIIQAKKVGFNRVNIKKILQKPFFVPESKNIDELFREMQKSKKHMAFLVDEYGGMSGIVTTEDMVEEVMGNIDDEYDDAEPKLEKIGDGEYEMDGNYYLDDLNEELGVKLESDDYETVGGLLIDLLGEIPDDNVKEKRVIEQEGGITFTVEAWKDRRIERVRMKIRGAETAKADAEREAGSAQTQESQGGG